MTRESTRQMQQKRLDEIVDRLEAEIQRTANRTAAAALSSEDTATAGAQAGAQMALVAKMRQVKASKLYFRDSGLLHGLLDIPDRAALVRHPKIAPSWEGFALEEVVRASAVGPGNMWFWATHGGAELDLLVASGTGREGFEFKYTDRPASTRSMHIAIEGLKLERLTVIYPGERRIPLTEKI